MTQVPLCPIPFGRTGYTSTPKAIGGRIAPRYSGPIELSAPLTPEFGSNPGMADSGVANSDRFVDGPTRRS
jgi:hypothetical protein